MAPPTKKSVKLNQFCKVCVNRMQTESTSNTYIFGIVMKEFYVEKKGPIFDRSKNFWIVKIDF